jgi:hypothetical protein
LTRTLEKWIIKEIADMGNLGEFPMGCDERVVMTKVHVMVLAGSLALLVCGCGDESQSQSLLDSIRPAEGRVAAEPVSATSRGRAEGPRLERYNFAVSGFRAIRDEFGMVSIVGEITNVGTLARGVELQATLRDARGRTTAVGYFYPISGNIMPEDTWPFGYSFGRQRDAVLAELRIVGIFRSIQ